MNSFHSRLRVQRFANASFFAAELFRDSFAIDFPIPRENCGLPIPTPPEKWHQFVAFFKWSAQSIEPVGFCNWIRYDEVYLEGGLCVRRDFYRRLSREQWQACRECGGVAQIMIEAAARQLNDCSAWFGYCGDRKSSIVNARVGFVPTDRRYIIAKWFRALGETEKARLTEKIAQIGPF